jgi:hypothetical protein
MSERQRWSNLSEPLRGAGYVVGLGLLIAIVATAIAALLTWVMT